MATLSQVGKSDGMRVFRFGNQCLAMTVHRGFEFRMQISLTECNSVEYNKSCYTMSFVKLKSKFLF